MGKINTAHAKNIIREQVGFERQFINVLDVTTNAWGAVEKIYFEVKGIFYTIEPDGIGGAIISFADAPEEPENAEAEEAEATDETGNAPEA